MRGTFLVILACFCWAMDTLIRYPLVERGIDPTRIVFLEHLVLVALFSLKLFPGLRRLGDLRLADFFSFVVVGALGSGLATVAFTEAFRYLNPSLVILLQKFQPVVAIVLSGLILKEEIQRPFLAWASVCLVGGLLISSPDLLRFWDLVVRDHALVLSDGAVRGYGLVGVSVLCWASATVFGKRLSSVGFGTGAIMGGRFLLGLLALAPFIDPGAAFSLPEGEDYLRLLIMVLISGALAMWLYYKGLHRLSAKTTAVAEMFFPFLAVVGNWIFLGKQLNDWQLLGGGVLLIGSLVIQLKKY